jgi:hypothetical protein
MGQSNSKAISAASQPKALYMSIGGFSRETSAVLWWRGVIRCVPPRAMLGDEENLVFTPSAEECRRFGRLWSDGSNQYPERFQRLLNAVKRLTHGTSDERV